MQETCAMLFEAYGGEAMEKSSDFEWHKWFKEGRENVEDYERSDRPRSYRIEENDEKVRNLVHSGRCLSIRTMAVELNLDKETARQV
jgi:hypothetical protein